MRFVSLLVFLPVLSAAAQAPVAGANWARVQQLAKGTKVHVSADSKGRVCSVDEVTEEALICSKGRLLGSARYTFARTEIKSVKLTRYAVSTLAGAGIGAGVAGAVGVATIKGGTFIDFSGEARAIVTVAGAVLGAVATGPVDAFRGPTVYRRP